VEQTAVSGLRYPNRQEKSLFSLFEDFVQRLRGSKRPKNIGKPVDFVVEGCPKRPGLFETFATAKRSTKWKKQHVFGLR
jgi:hypothetical protein